ncbi:hypothetical protein BDZ90DRAFT_519 [Jaminaea rosea]|uniref:Uncharacterized protein n=1 Tax=Jaminaea rosea TaxID=1569628 RepID=A0A316UYN2_9BASI|nr:hypothetical protein BDZ90DRAFT_519 [Jaminaea rosea]PWN29898.1 hypothetical protein BDZ90DRAFT_519 [Jaminaea rosea]
MSASQRLFPLFAASVVGVATGYYIFDPILRQYSRDTSGTFQPEQINGGAGSSPSKPEAVPSLTRGILAQDEGQKRADELRAKATMNAAQRASEAAKERAEKTGEGKVV